MYNEDTYSIGQSARHSANAEKDNICYNCDRKSEYECYDCIINDRDYSGKII